MDPSPYSDQPTPAAPPAPDNTARNSTLTALRIVFVLACLAFVVFGPRAIGRFYYYSAYNSLKAEADVATETLDELKPQLTDFVLASRMVAKRVSPSVVGIYRPGKQGPTRQGSGVIVNESGYVLTNYHVVAGASELHVRLMDGRDQEAVAVGGDPGLDLAVLRINLPDLIAADWGDSDATEVGDLVWALGSPFGLDRSITFGIVSAKARGAGSGVARYPQQEFLQTDAAVNPGNSGGPLVNLNGEIVGINTAIIGDRYSGVSFAIPSNVAREKYEQLVARGWVAWGFLGVRPEAVPLEMQQNLGLDEGVYVARVETGGPADEAGIQVGDVILRWNDQIATSPSTFSRTIASTEVGSRAKVVLARPQPQEDAEDDFQQLELEVVVGRHPDF